MSLKKIDKRLTIPVAYGEVSERMWNHMESSVRKGQKEINILRSFCTFGFMVQELGGGVIDAFLSMESNGELEGMSAQQRAEVLIKKLQLVSGTTRIKTTEAEQEAPPVVQSAEESPKPKKKLSSISMDMG